MLTEEEKQMKNATNRIIEQLPVVKDHLEEKNMNLIPLELFLHLI